MRLLAPFGVLVLALVLVVRFDAGSGDADLVFVNQNEVFTLDPQRMSYIQDLRLAHVLYEGLVRWDNTDFSVLPAAATNVPDPQPDGRTYRFEIRPTARWSNGDPVTAHDFIYAWKRAIFPDTAADYSNLFFVIDGAESFFHWRVAQTAGFVTDPWAPDATPDTVIAAARRMIAALGVKRLRDGDGNAPGSGDDDRALVREIESLRRAAEAGGPDLEDAIANAQRARAWWNHLDTPASRAKERDWMWEEADRLFTESVGLRARGDRTLEVRLARPTAYFLDLLCFGVFFPVHRPTVEGWPANIDTSAGWHAVAASEAGAPGFEACRWIRLDETTGKLEQKHGWAKPGRHVGNGTHVLDVWRYKRDLLLAANPRYHDPGRVRTKTILAITIEDTNTAVLAFESGRVDWLVDVDAEYQSDMLEQLSRYRERHAVELRDLLASGFSEDDALARLPDPGPGERRDIHVFPTFGTDFYSFNCRPTLNSGRPNPFADPAVRRAFVMSVDKKEIVERITRLDEPVATTLIPPGSIAGYASPAGLPHDAARARAELASAGWSDRDGDGLVENERREPFPVIDLLYTTNVPRYKWMSLNLKSQWERGLGVRIELRGVETKFYKEDLKQGKFMIARGRWYGDYGDPTTFLDLCRSTDGNNDRGYESAVIDDLLDRAADERDRAKRLAILSECERILFDEEVPMLPICQLVQVYMYDPARVHGLSDHPRLTQFLWQMRVDDGTGRNAP